jgi:5-methylcytosine-specific restriction endonuclease McrA
MRKPKTKICENCKKEWTFMAGSPREFKDRKFCSRDCANKGNSEKNSKAKLGSKNPRYKKKPWNKGIFGEVKHPENSKDKNWNWKGGVCRDKYKLRRSGEWKRWRKEIFERDKYTCKKCGIVGGHLVPHHIKLFSYFVEERFIKNNGVTLCEKCHKKLHRENQGKTIIKI